jgi:hypothetical protein
MGIDIGQSYFSTQKTAVVSLESQNLKISKQGMAHLSHLRQFQHDAPSTATTAKNDVKETHFFALCLPGNDSNHRSTSMFRFPAAIAIIRSDFAR